MRALGSGIGQCAFFTRPGFTSAVTSGSLCERLAGRALWRPVVGMGYSGSWWLDLLAGLAAALLLAWVALIAALVIVRPRGGLAREAVRLLPDVL